MTTNEDMTEQEPNGVVLLGLRAWMSLLGIGLILVGSWRFDRRWDDSDDNAGGGGANVDDIETKTATTTKQQQQKRGTFSSSTTTKQQQQQTPPEGFTRPSWTNVGALVNEYAESAYRTITHPNDPQQQQQPEQQQSGDSSLSGDALRQRVYDLLFTSPYGGELGIALAGWALLMLSCFVTREYGIGVTFSGRAWMQMLTLAIIGLIQSIILPTAITGQRVHRHRFVLAAALSLSYLVLALWIALGDESSAAAVPMWLPVAGAFGIVSG
jgi:hypothetical protein